jgi:ABC-2 type transport system permease protein
MEGKFGSFFKGKQSPLFKLLQKNSKKKEKQDAISGVIEHSPESARIILFSSNEFLEDQTLQLAGMAQSAKYLATSQLMENTLEWALEDRGLLSIRARGHFNRTLPPMKRDDQLFWEIANYVFVLIGLILMMAWKRVSRKRIKSRYQSVASEVK